MPLNQSNLKHLCNKILQLIDIYNLAHLYTNNDNNPQKKPLTRSPVNIEYFMLRRDLIFSIDQTFACLHLVLSSL